MSYHSDEKGRNVSLDFFLATAEPPSNSTGDFGKSGRGCSTENRLHAEGSGGGSEARKAREIKAGRHIPLHR